MSCSTAPNGSATTSVSTIVIANPHLNTDAPSSTTTFFTNHGAVAGLFAGIGVALAAAALFLVFCIRRRRRTRRLEHDTAVQAELAAAGFGRSPLHDDDDDDDGAGEMRQRRSSSALGFGYASSSSPSRPTIPGLAGTGVGARYGNVSYSTLAQHGGAGSTGPPTPGVESGFASYADPFATPGITGAGAGERQALMSTPPPGAMPPALIGLALDGSEAGGHRPAGSTSTGTGSGHAPTPSAGSIEPLIAGGGHARANSESSAAPSPPPRNPQRAVDRGLADPGGGAPEKEKERDKAPEMRRASSVYSEESADGSGSGGQDARLGDVLDDEPRDEEDYSRRLEVRNIPDSGASIVSKDD
jgi:hypothetical protein